MTVRLGPLAGDYHPHGGGPFAVLWVHGFGSHRGGEKSAAVRDECDRRGWPFAAFDVQGHGESAGDLLNLTPDRPLADLEQVADFLRESGHPRVGLVGSSMGGFASAWFAKRHPGRVAGCVLLAPAFGFLRRRWDVLSPAEQAEWQTRGRRRLRSEWVDVEVGYGLVAGRERWTPEELANGWTTPTLLVHGLADDAVPVADSLDFLRAVPGPDAEAWLIRAGDHRLTAYKDRIAAAAGRFFAGRLPPPG